MPLLNKHTHSHNSITRISALLLSTLLFITSAMEGASYTTNSEGVMIIEAEEMELTSAKVVSEECSSDGKGIYLLSAEAAPTLSILFPIRKPLVSA